MNKDIDCIKMKQDLQEQLYKDIDPVDFDDYYYHLKERSKNNKFIKNLRNNLKQQSNKKTIPQH